MAVARRRLLKKPNPVTREEDKDMIPFRDLGDAANAALLGKELKVLIDRIEGEHYVGRTEFDSPEVDNEVFIPISGGYLRVGDFAQVRITSHTPYDLFGDIA
ncbi:MAG: hypothetical protein ACOVSS_08175 [Bacteroidia bacterium]